MLSCGVSELEVRLLAREAIVVSILQCYRALLPVNGSPTSLILEPPITAVQRTERQMGDWIASREFGRRHWLDCRICLCGVARSIFEA